MFLSAKYAYYNTGFVPDAGRRHGACRPGRNIVTQHGRTGRSAPELNVRPQHTANADLQLVRQPARGASHDVRYGVGFRKVDAYTGTLWPGNGILAIAQTPTDLSRAGLPRRQRHEPREVLSTSTPATRSRAGGSTIDFGVRYDRQWRRGAAEQHARRTPRSRRSCRASTSPATTRRSPGTTCSPRAGLTYALDEARKTRGARQLQPLRRPARLGHRRLHEPEHRRRASLLPLDRSRTATSARRPTKSTDQFSSPRRTASTRPTRRAVTSANRIDPEPEAPVTQQPRRRARPRADADARRLDVNYTLHADHATCSATRRVTSRRASG